MIFFLNTIINYYFKYLYDAIFYVCKYLHFKNVQIIFDVKICIYFSVSSFY